MPTKQLETVLYRELSKVEAEPLISIASPLLQELINYATNAYMRCGTSPSGKENEDVAVNVLYLHVIEMTDGTEALISECCAGPAVPLLRSSFEALISIEYILEANYVQRSLSWLADYIHSRLTGWKALDVTTPEGKDFLEALKSDTWVHESNFGLMEFGQNEVEDAASNLEDLLKKQYFKDIEEEFVRYQKLRHRRASWYQLFDGPANLRELARYVGRHAQYDFLYRRWSAVTHANDLSRFAKTRLRDPDAVNNVAVFASYFILAATRLLLKKFRPGEEQSLRNWYLREVRDSFRTLSAQ